MFDASSKTTSDAGDTTNRTGDLHVATLSRNGSSGVSGSGSKALTAADLVDQCLYLPVGIEIVTALNDG